MATHSSILAWKISQTEELVGYNPWSCKKSERTESADNGSSDLRNCSHSVESGPLGHSSGHVCVYVCVLVAQSCLTLCNPMDCSPLSMGFPRQEYWSGLLFPTPGDPSNPGIKPTTLVSPALAGGFFTTSNTWEVEHTLFSHIQVSYVN